MNEPETTWIAPLRKLLDDVRSPQPGKEGLDKMIAALADVESILAQNHSQMPPELVHFLERRSYDKAARYCDGNLGSPRGTCGVRA